MSTADRIATMIHAFDDAERKQEVRRLAERVKRMEEALEAFQDSITFGETWGAWFRVPGDRFPKAKSDRELRALLWDALDEDA